MKNLDQIAENRMLNSWIDCLSRHPAQINRPHEADSELIPLPGCDQVLALTSDTIAEEISLGFYRDPYTIGWMAAAVSLSDLAAVGARPVGLLVSVTLPESTSKEYREQMAAGIDAACRNAGTYILGGDTNTGTPVSITTTGAGLVEKNRILQRKGCRPGDLLYSTGYLGTGGMVAAMAHTCLGGNGSGYRFRPQPRIREARHFSEYITACMDSSDGLIATLDQLARLNGAGFELTLPPADIVDPAVRRFCEELDLDPLLMLAQPHGEFELIFTIREGDRERLERHARACDSGLLLLGRAVPEDEIRFARPEVRIIDSMRIRNLLSEVNGDAGRYAEELAAILKTP
jgi:thiamine-monophosphate kinase